MCALTAGPQSVPLAAVVPAATGHWMSLTGVPDLPGLKSCVLGLLRQALDLNASQFPFLLSKPLAQPTAASSDWAPCFPLQSVPGSVLSVLPMGSHIPGSKTVRQWLSPMHACRYSLHRLSGPACFFIPASLLLPSSLSPQ